MGHQCEKREPRVLVLQEEDEVVGDKIEPLVEVAKMVELSLNSVMGLSTPGTMKLKGTIRQKELF